MLGRWKMHCYGCGHTWLSIRRNKGDKPKRCPKCGNYEVGPLEWNK